MKYPTAEEVEAADRTTVCQWWRFLDSPGMWAIGKPEFESVLMEEARIMDAISKRLTYLGGFTPKISKAIGWDFNE